MRMKRNATTGRTQRSELRNMVSHTLGWFKEFLAVPGIQTNIGPAIKNKVKELL